MSIDPFARGFGGGSFDDLIERFFGGVPRARPGGADGDGRADLPGADRGRTDRG